MAPVIKDIGAFIIITVIFAILACVMVDHLVNNDLSIAEYNRVMDAETYELRR